METIQRQADNHARNLAPVIEALKAEGHTSLGALATELNRRGMLTPCGGCWHKTSVKNLLARLEQLGMHATP